jgi:hypothetical protein
MATVKSPKTALAGFQKAIIAALEQDIPHEDLRKALEDQLRDEAERKLRAEAERLRRVGFRVEAEINGRVLWVHPKSGESFWHEEALSTLRGDQ